VVLVNTLSLAATTTVGLAVAASGAGFRPLPVGGALVAMCLVLEGVAFVRRNPVPALPGSSPYLRRARLVPWPVAFASIPALVLTLLLVVQVAGAARYRSADSYYTQLSLEPARAPGAAASVVVSNRERTVSAYRYEERIGGTLLRTRYFTLEPGEARTLAAPSRPADAHVEVRLYRAGESTPYRWLRW
jgi:hypothetical protein